MKIAEHYLTPKTTTDQNPDIGVLTLHIDMPTTDSGITDIEEASALYRADRLACWEADYEPLVTGTGTLTRDGSHVTLVMPISVCGSLFEPFPALPGAFTLGRTFSPGSASVLHTVNLTWNDGTNDFNAKLPAPAKVQNFHVWSFTRISESTSLATIKGTRYRNVAGALEGWDAPNQKWKRLADGKVVLYFTPPGGTRRWVATKNTASDGSYRFRTSNTKAGTWRVYFRTTLHYWTSSRSLSVH